MNGYSNGPHNRGVAQGPNKDWRIGELPSLAEADPRGVKHYWNSAPMKQFSPVLSPTGYIQSSLEAFPRG